MSDLAELQAVCPNCLTRIPRNSVARHERERQDEPVLYDLEELLKIALNEKAHDEAVQVRVTQDDIVRLLERRRKPRK